MRPLITVGITFYNAEATLRLAIESVLSQDCTDFELILVNDGSTDGGAAIAREYLDDPRVRFIHRRENLGAAARHNQITQAARGAYIARMDADDAMHPSRLRKQAAVLDADPSIDLVASAIYLVGPGHRILGRRRTSPSILCHRFSYIRPFHPTVTGRREWFARNPDSGAAPRCHDAELWIRTAGEARIVCLEEPLLFYNRAGLFDAAKTVRTLRDYGRVLRLHPERTCLWCRSAALALIAMKVAACRMLAAAGLTGLAARRWHVDRVDPRDRRQAETTLRELISIAAERKGVLTSP
jgi:glycosyltransferase involved in cell wall biosynthesis